MQTSQDYRIGHGSPSIELIIICFLFNSAEHEICPAHNCQNANLIVCILTFVGMIFIKQHNYIYTRISYMSFKDFFYMREEMKFRAQPC